MIDKVELLRCGDCRYFEFNEDSDDYGEGDCWRYFHPVYDDSSWPCPDFEEKEKKIMEKIKLFSRRTDFLEDYVNEWLTDNPNIRVIDMQYQYQVSYNGVEHSSVMIRYMEE